MPRHLKLFGVYLLVVAAGCGRPPAPQYDNVYKGLSENLPKLDPAILSGRRILIDPGHGGHFRGTRGQKGLEEARVNLGVSLYLWGLLREAGAEVFLTRSAEKDFLTVADSTLAGELSVRVAMVDSLRPDILVSIHHNAQNDRDPQKNSVETYYRFGDQASRDLAFAVHRHLMRNLGIDDGEVRPGNYFILRNIDIPAILGEASYLTHPGVEDNLRLSEKRRLEAEAYFLGILEYFSRGTPSVEIVSPTDSALTDVPTLRFAVSDIGGIGVDPASIDLKVNGRPVDAHMDDSGKTILYRLPWDAPNGSYVASIGIRNLLGNSSEVRRLQFDIDLPPRTATFEWNPETLPPPGGAVRVRARLLDRRGLSVADSTRVGIETSWGNAPRMALVDHGFVEFPVTVTDGKPPLTVTLSARGKSFQLAMEPGPVPGSPLRKLVIANILSGKPIRHATVAVADSLVADGSMSGLYFLPGGSGEQTMDWVTAWGYQPLQYHVAHDQALPDTLFLTPWYQANLLGRRFVIDPEGGSGVDPGMGQLGLSGPLVNLRVALYLAEYLRAAGAIVELTRRTEQTLSPRDVVALTNRFDADRYIEIRHRSTPEDSGLTVEAYFFPGSRTGSAMAADVQAATARFLRLETRSPQDLVTFPLQQTACPAIVIEYPGISSIEEELRLGEPWYQRKQAYGVFVGILIHFGVEDSTELRLQIGTESDPTNWLVTVDKTWSLLTDPTGSATFFGLPGDQTHRIDVRKGRTRLSTPLPPDPLTTDHSRSVIIPVQPDS
jgi:N-acetylmuramoyl-L-alanine amidase